jgi:two-component system nitrogen regulation sensor histidine kinase NtrY
MTDAVRDPDVGRRRRPIRDNTRALVGGIVALLVLLVALLTLASRSSQIAPDVLTEFVFYALSATNLTILVALVFVLARNIVKLVVERRRGLPFARFRAKLVAVLLGMTIVPAVLVLLVGSEVIRNSVDRWFNAPMNDVLSAANAIAGDYYAEQQRRVSSQAERAAEALEGADLASPGTALRDRLGADEGAPPLVAVFRVNAGASGARAVPVARLDGVGAPPGYTPGQPLADEVVASGHEARLVEAVQAGGDLIRAAAPIRAANGSLRGVVVVSEYLTSELASRARRITRAYEGYQQLLVLKQPLASVYLSFFLMLTLMILVGATWMGLYLAKRITRPIQLLATAAGEIGAGHLEHRVVAETRDEFGSLIEAFNRMAGNLAASRDELERSAVDLERRHHEVEGRRRYVETVLDRIASGVMSLDTAGRIRTANAAATQLLAIDASAAGQPVADALDAPDLKPFADVVQEALRSRADIHARDVAIARAGRELNLSIVATPLRREDGASEGVVIVFDDVTPLVHAQKVAAWREVARRLAHEIKNPLTPIQLSAERIRRHAASAPDPLRGIVEECTGTIVGEVESLKGLVDEFSQFARMPAPRAVPTDLHGLVADVLGLYRGIFTDVEIRSVSGEGLPKVAVDPEQMRRVLINVIDNAIEAIQQHGTIEIATQYEPSNNLVRLVVADDGPGIPPSERDKLFLPYYSTKRRGSGLGLAIVRRIVAEHGGSIDVSDNVPHGTRFVIELPA